MGVNFKNGKRKIIGKNLFDYSRTIAKPLLETVDYPWEALPKISEFIIELGKTLDPEIYEQRGENVWVAKSAKVFDSAYLGGPLIICEDAEIRQCAFIRGNAIVGRGAVVGNSTELKNSILLTVFRLRTITTSVTVFSATSHTQAQV